MGGRAAGRRVLILLASLSCMIEAIAAQPADLTPHYKSVVDWADNRITIDANVDVSSLGAMVPQARAAAERAVNDNLATMADKTLFPIQANSFHTVGDLAATSPQVVTALQSLITPKDEQFAKLSTNLEQVTVRYQLPIFPNLGRIFVNQVKANPPAGLLSFVPTTKFSGIVIYAKGSLPVHGEHTTAHLVPSLFPRIWDANMTLLASADTVDPSILRSRGMVAFSNSTDEKPFTARVGLVPFRTVAVGLFGKSPTDVIISNRAAERILASPENIKLLTEGRILIIANLPQTRVTTGG